MTEGGVVAAQRCVQCGCEGTSQCGRCGVVTYCSKQCQLADWPAHKRLCGGPVMVAAVEGKGRGLVAVRDIAAGELITRDRAVLTLSWGVSYEDAGEDIRLLQRQVNSLPDVDRDRFYKLSSRKTILQKLRDSPYKEATAIFFNNAIASDGFNVMSSNNGHERSVYLTLSLLNHSCAPNSAYTDLTRDSRTKELRAVQDIRKGEEVTITYLGFQALLRDTGFRLRRLAASWGFVCSCGQCDNTRRALHEGSVTAEIRRLMKSKESMLKSKASEILDFINMADLYKQIVEHVRKLSCAPLLMPQFAKDLADSAHLARKPILAKEGMDLFRDIAEKRKSSELLEMYEDQEKRFADCKSKFDVKSVPGIPEILYILGN